MNTIASPGKTRRRTRFLIVTLAAFLLVAVVFGVFLTSGAQAYSYSEEEIAFVKLLNDYRKANGLSTLLVSDLISQACYRHNHDMAKYAFFSHYTTKSDWFASNALPWDRMAMSGYNFYTSKGENIAAGQSTAAQVFQAWKNSPGHNANMLNSTYKVIGINQHSLASSPYTFYWTTDFGGYVDSTAHTVTAPPSIPTTRLEENDAKLGYTGTWHTSAGANESGGRYTYVNAPASVSITFSGTYLAYVTKKGPSYGYAKITLDGKAPVTVDLYNATTIYQQKVWNTGTLPNGTHTVKIEWTGSRRSAATASNIGLDAFDVGGTAEVKTTTSTTPTTTLTAATPATTRYQQTDSRFLYAGSWATFSSSSASAGAYKRANVNGSSVTVTFNGTYLGWVATKGTTLGKAYVSLDGGPAKVIDLARSSVAYQQKVWNTGVLPAGIHTVKIWRHPDNPTGKYISIDAFDIAGTVVTQSKVAVGGQSTRYEQTDSRLLYSGTWYTFSTTGPSGGTYKRANTNGASVTVKFTGTYLAWIATKGVTLGKAYVSLDGGPAKLIDLSRSSVAYQQKVWNTGVLPAGAHTVKIWWYPDNITGKYISVDAFEVEGTLN